MKDRVDRTNATNWWNKFTPEERDLKTNVYCRQDNTLAISDFNIKHIVEIWKKACVDFK